MKYVLVISALVIHFSTQAQTFEYLDINNIKARVNTCYDPLFTDNTTNMPSFEAPIGSGRHSVYASNLWISGLDQNNNICLAGATFNTNHDYVPGPIMDSIHYAVEIPQWNRVWKINRTEIDNHLLNYMQIGYTVPQVFLDWPAHGDTTLGQEHYLAPFEDLNQNGIYDPINGDYPQIPGDQCVFYIFNDDTVHMETGGMKLKIEVHAFVYAFDCPQDSALFNSVFVKYKIFNRSTKDYYQTSIGSWSDLDLGGAADDYVGSNVRTGTYYAYNGDTYDDNFQGEQGYYDLLPIQAVTILSGPLADEDAIDNPLTTDIQNAIDSLGIPYEGLGYGYGDGVIDNEHLGLTGFRYYNNSGQGGNPATFDPGDAWEYFQYLHAVWLDSTHMVYGGNAHQASSGAIANGLIECDFMFPSDSDPLNWNTHGIPPMTTGWNETTEGFLPSDRRGLGWTGNFVFESGSMEEIDLSFVFAADYQNLNIPLAAMDEMENRIVQIRSYFSQNYNPCGGGLWRFVAGDNDIVPEENSFALFPNPATHQFILDYQGEEREMFYVVHDISGKEIVSGKINSVTTTIDCSTWGNGIYLIKVGDENGYVTKKIVVE